MPPKGKNVRHDGWAIALPPGSSYDFYPGSFRRTRAECVAYMQARCHKAVGFRVVKVRLVLADAGR